jgi:CRP-like cAMP-binding protein
MARLLLTGDWRETPGAVLALLADGHAIASEDHAQESELAIVGVTSAASLGAPRTGGRALPWLAWNQAAGADVERAAYSAGAAAVVSADAGVEPLLQAVRTAALSRRPEHARRPARSTRYRQGEVVPIPEATVLEVLSGVAGQYVLHDDGAEVLLGLYGAGHLLIDHPDDSCDIRVLAHTEVEAVSRAWAEAAGQEGFQECLAARLRMMEAWAAAQAHPHLDQRILGVLYLLAEQFGEPSPMGTVITVRVTHSQLASAVGTTRPTVTRTLARLRALGKLTAIGTATGERFCLPVRQEGGRIVLRHAVSGR